MSNIKAESIFPAFAELKFRVVKRNGWYIVIERMPEEGSKVYKVIDRFDSIGAAHDFVKTRVAVFVQELYVSYKVVPK